MMDRVTFRSRLQGYGVLLYSVKCIITNMKATYTHKKRLTVSLRSEIYCWTSLQSATKRSSNSKIQGRRKSTQKSYAMIIISHEGKSRSF